MCLSYLTSHTPMLHLPPWSASPADWSLSKTVEITIMFFNAQGVYITCFLAEKHCDKKAWAEAFFSNSMVWICFSTSWRLLAGILLGGTFIGIAVVEMKCSAKVVQPEDFRKKLLCCSFNDDNGGIVHEGTSYSLQCESTQRIHWKNSSSATFKTSTA